jgi:uncharacterized protein
MRVLITGDTGFVGKAIVAALRERGDALVVVSRDAARARALGDVAAVEGDLQTPGPWTAGLAGADAVIHLAGAPIAARRWSAQQKQMLRDSRVETTRVLVEAMAAAPDDSRPRTLITASGSDYYPFAPDNEFDDDEVTERDPPGDSFLARLCRDWEAEAQGAERLGVRVVRMRTAMVLGPGGGALARLKTQYRLFAGGRIGSGRQWVPWIHRDDAVRAYLTALDDDRYIGPINLVTSAARNEELSRAIGKALHRPSWLPVPSFALRAALGEFAEYLLNGRRMVPARLRELGFTWTRPSLEQAVADG